MRQARRVLICALFAASFFLFLATPGVDRLSCLVILLCAAVSSIAGFAFSALAAPLLLHVTNDALHAVEIMVVASIALQTYSVCKLRKNIVAKSLLPYFAGGLLTVVPGIFLLLYAPSRTYLLALGGLLTAYAAYALIRPPIRLTRNPLLGRIAMGALGGLTGALAAFPGAAVTIWCAAHGWEKERQRAIYQPFILGMQVITLAALAAARPSDALRPDLLQYVPPAIAGSYIGLRIFDRMSNAHFNKVVSAFLLVSGLALWLKAF